MNMSDSNIINMATSTAMNLSTCTTINLSTSNNENMNTSASTTVPCVDISNLGSVWGKHLNHKPKKVNSNSAYDKVSNKLGLQLSQVVYNTTRTSLKKRKKTFQSFTDTLGLNTSHSDMSHNKSYSTSPPASLSTTSATIPSTTSAILPSRSPSPEYDLFPSLPTGKVVIGPAKINTKTERRIDQAWLQRCAGMGGETGHYDTPTRNSAGKVSDLAIPAGDVEVARYRSAQSVAVASPYTDDTMGDKATPVLEHVDQTDVKQITLSSEKVVGEDNLNAKNEKQLQQAAKSSLSSRCNKNRKRDSESDDDVNQGDDDYTRSESEHNTDTEVDALPL